MKRNIFIAVLGMSAVAAYGQGQIDFSNYLTGPSDPKVTYAGNGVAVGSEFSAQLLYYVGASVGDIPTSIGQLQTLTVSGASPVAFTLGAGGGDGSAYAGWFEGGVVTIPGISAANAGFVSFAIEAFNGASYATSTIRGVSSIFQSPTTSTSSSGIGGFTPGSWESFTVSPVPEPTTLALAGLGLASLLTFRRKRA